MKMKHILAGALGLLAAGGGSLLAQNTVTIDPVDPLTGYTSLAEWNSDGDQEGWTAAQLIPTVAGGSLSGTTSGGDTQLILNPFGAAIYTGPTNRVEVEVGITRDASDTTPLQLFWIDNTAPAAFAAARSLILVGASAPIDGGAHVYRFTLNNINGSLKGLRLDSSEADGLPLSFDYVRLKVAAIVSEIDPIARLNYYTSVGEFNTDGNQESWTVANVTTPVVAGGRFSGTTVGNDPQFRSPALSLDVSSGLYQIVEIRMRRQAGDTSRIDLFWADTSSGARRAVVNDNQWPDDGQFHIVQFPLGNFPIGTIQSLRLDPVSNVAASRTVDVDYVRIGIIDADDDLDGLANLAETNTDIFVSAKDTGTDPNDDDSDDDGFKDGVEVSFGTDPNNGLEFPKPTLVQYTLFPALYTVDLAIAENVPTVELGTATGFSITPSLPAGLNFNTATGVISGTPTAIAGSTVYAVTANFGGGISSTYDLTLEVRNPRITGYTSVANQYYLGTAVANNFPITVGADPTSYSISPALPAGLSFDEASGMISGTPTASVPLTSFVITANYGAYPVASFTLTIKVNAIPVLLGVDGPTLGSYVSLGEWENAGSLEGWTVTNAGATANGGIVTVERTAADPQFKSPIGPVDLSMGTVLELRVRQSDVKEIQFFWADANGGFSGNRSTIIAPANIIADGQFHIYQLQFENVFSGSLTQLRIDPGANPGGFVEIDYVRFGTVAPAADPVITAFDVDPLFGDVSITWNSIQGVTYIIESSPDLSPESWRELVDGFVGGAGTSTYFGLVPASERFFRVVRQP